MDPETTLELLPGNPGKPVFANRHEAEAFWADFYKKIEPELRANEEARRRSIRDAMHRFVS